MERGLFARIIKTPCPGNWCRGFTIPLGGDANKVPIIRAGYRELTIRLTLYGRLFAIRDSPAIQEEIWPNHPH